MTRRSILAGLVALAGAADAVRADNLELALLIDGSGSISTANFTLQKNGYVNALSDITVLPLDGTVSIGVWQFSTTGNNSTPSIQSVYPTTTINAGNIAALTAAIGGMVQIDYNTPIGVAIEVAANDLLNNLITSDRQVIDVSTDGNSNVGIDPTTAAANAIAAGIEQVNGIGIGGSANLNWVPAGSFKMNVDNFDDFGAAIKEKIRREVIGVPDGGMTALMLGTGVFGLALAKRRVAGSR